MLIRYLRDGSALAAADAEALTIPHIVLASKDEPADVVSQYKEILEGGQKGKTGVVETYATMNHGWMGVRAKLDVEDDRKEYERGYKQVADFFNKQYLPACRQSIGASDLPEGDAYYGFLVRRYTTLTNEAVFYFDPHVCTRCRYRSTELLWQCPQCHEWDTFVEERLSAANDSPTAELEPTEP